MLTTAQRWEQPSAGQCVNKTAWSTVHTEHLSALRMKGFLTPATTQVNTGGMVKRGMSWPQEDRGYRIRQLRFLEPPDAEARRRMMATRL